MIYSCHSQDKSAKVEYVFNDEEIKNDPVIVFTFLAAAEKFHKEFPNIRKFVVMTKLPNDYYCNYHFFLVTENGIVELTSYLGIRFFYNKNEKVIRQ